MIISHKHKFIFIKTRKTAGTSLEVFLSGICDKNDIVTPIYPEYPGHVARNYNGCFNLFSELCLKPRPPHTRNIIKRFFKKRKYYNHIQANQVRNRVGKEIWDEYFTFCVERDPWSRSVSHYNMLQNFFPGKYIDFNDYLNRSGVYNHPLYTDEKGKIIVDKVINFDNLKAELLRITKKLGIPNKGLLEAKAKQNFKKFIKSSKDLSSQQVEFIKHKYKIDIDLMNFEYSQL